MRWSRHAVPACLLALVLALWTWAAIGPVDRQDWLLENLLVFLFVPLLVATYPRFRFSNLSYGLLAAFVALHVVGSHWSYSLVPWPDWAALGFHRNMYDRAVHLSYGLLLTIPAREAFASWSSGKAWRASALALGLILATSAAYEILEWATMSIVAPQLGDAFLGSQGDPFDSVEDMASAGAGSILAVAATHAALALTSARRRITRTPVAKPTK